ncbi:MAG: FeoA family protein [Vagococcus sp.]
MESVLTCKLNHAYQFVEYSGESSYERHLRNLGLVKGTELYIVSRVPKQPLIVLFKGIRIGLDETIAKGIRIVEKDASLVQASVPLNDLRVGMTSRVVTILGQGAVKRRLMDMGLTRGTTVTVRKLAPLGDPIEITVRNYELTLRKQEAELILVEEVPTR